MNDAPREKLRELIERYGPGLSSDARRCEGLLRDLAGAHRREINILMGALEERVPLDLLAARNTMPRDLLLARLSRRLEDSLALTEEAARWAVESWALALGVVTDAELKERRKPPDEVAPPRPEPEPPRAKAEPPPAPTPRPPTPLPPRPPAPPPRLRTAPAPTPVQRPRAAPAPLQTTPPSPVRPSAPAKVSWRTPNTAPTQDPAAEPRPRRGRWRGCLVGCVLLVALAALLVLGGPFVFNVLREEQQQRNEESAPVQTR